MLTQAEGPLGERILWAINPIIGAAEELTTELPQNQLVVPAGNTAFFFLSDALWKTDGAGVGTVLVMSGLAPPSRGAALVEGNGATLPLVIFKVATSPASLWASDGTAAGTVMIHNGTNATLGERMMASGGRALIVGTSTPNNFKELYLTDGTAAGTTQLTARELDGGFEASGLSLVGTAGGGWFYEDTRADTGRELWFTDGTTTTLIELTPGATHSLAFGTVGATLDDLLIFSAFTLDRGFELWSSDGTVLGTVPLEEVLPGPAGQTLRPVASGSSVFFAAIGPNGGGLELWSWELALFEDGFESGNTSMWSATAP